MKILDCHVFTGHKPLNRDIICSHRVATGSKMIKDYLREKHGWEWHTPVATMAARLMEEGELDTVQLHMFSRREGFQKESSTFYHNQ